MKVIEAPNPLDWNDLSRWVFLAGSIENGKACHWQDEAIKNLSSSRHVTILNPRRKDWNSSWIQSIDNAEFKRQVEWELEGLKSSDVVIFYFDPETLSSISLMELGFCAAFGKVIYLCCPAGYWKKGNVDILCELYKNNIRTFSSLDELTKQLQQDIIGRVG